MKKFYKFLVCSLFCMIAVFTLSACDASNVTYSVRVEDGYVQWQAEGDNSWNNIMSVDDLIDEIGDDIRGATGNVGADGKQVEFQKSETHIQWRYVGDNNWTDLIALSDLDGDKGDEGDQGQRGSFNFFGTTYYGRTADFSEYSETGISAFYKGDTYTNTITGDYYVYDGEDWDFTYKIGLYSVNVSTFAELGLAVMDDVCYEIHITADITIAEDVILPSEKLLVLNSGVTLTIAEGTTVGLEGEIDDTLGTVVLNGTVANVWRDSNNNPYCYVGTLVENQTYDTTMTFADYDDGADIAFVNCTFNMASLSDRAVSSARIMGNLSFINCTFNSNYNPDLDTNENSGGNKCIYLTSFDSLNILGCTFEGVVSKGPAASASYILDLNVISCDVSEINIIDNEFNATGYNDSSAIAISIKARRCGLTDEDNPSTIVAKDGTTLPSTAATIETVKIIGNTFTEDNDDVYIGTNTKKYYDADGNIVTKSNAPENAVGVVNLTTGAFDVVVSNNTTDVNVYERYRYSTNKGSSETLVPILVEAQTSETFGNKPAI